MERRKGGNAHLEQCGWTQSFEVQRNIKGISLLTFRSAGFLSAWSPSETMTTAAIYLYQYLSNNIFHALYLLIYIIKCQLFFTIVELNF